MTMPTSFKNTLLAALGSAALLLTACTVTEPLPAISPEGLALEGDTSLNELYLRPETDFSGYSKIQIKALTVDYSNQRHSNTAGLKEEDFRFDDKELATFQQRFNEALSSELGLELVDYAATGDSAVRQADAEDGDAVLSDTLVATATIEEMHLNASIKNKRAGRDQAFVEDSSKMDIYLTLTDSESGELLLKSKHHKTTGWGNRGAGNMQPMNSVTYWRDASQAFKQWAKQHKRHLQLPAEDAAVAEQQQASN